MNLLFSTLPWVQYWLRRLVLCASRRITWARLYPGCTSSRTSPVPWNRGWPSYHYVDWSTLQGKRPCRWRSDVYSVLSCYTCFPSNQNSSVSCCTNRRTRHRAILLWITPVYVCRTSYERDNTIRLQSTDVRISMLRRNHSRARRSIRLEAIRIGVGSSARDRRLDHRWLRQPVRCMPNRCPSRSTGTTVIQRICR